VGRPAWGGLQDGGFDPGVLAVVLEAGAVGIGFALPGMEGLFASIPGLGNVFGHAVQEALIGVILNGIDAVELTVEDDAAREVGIGQIIGDARAIVKPIGVHGVDGAGIDTIDFMDEPRDGVEEALDHEELVHVESGVVVQVDGVSDAADSEVLNVGSFAAENGDNLIGVALLFEGLQIIC